MSEITYVSVARAFALAAHQAVGQKRKYTGDPYFMHPERVAQIVAETGTATNAMVCAAFLHDVLEDTQVREADIDEVFGPLVSKLVVELTNTTPKSAGNRAKRFQIEKARIALISPEAKTIKLADLIDNGGSIITADPSFAKVYMAEKRELLDVLANGDDHLWLRAKVMVDLYFNHQADKKLEA